MYNAIVTRFGAWPNKTKFNRPAATDAHQVEGPVPAGPVERVVGRHLFRRRQIREKRAVARLTDRLWLKDVGRNEYRLGRSFVIHPMHSVFVLGDGSSWTVRLRSTPAMIDDLSLHDIINCRSVFMFVDP
jgi:hypothetical protein